MLTELREYQKIFFEKIDFTYKRYFFNQLDFNHKMIGIVGARGVGKTTFLIQYLKQIDIAFSKKLYISTEFLKVDSLFEVAKAFYKEEGQLLVIDEIHKFKNFEIELKKIYDLLDLKIIFSGSSALQIDNAKADLSRRVITHTVYGLSFREFLELKHDIKLPYFSLQDILTNHIDIAHELLGKFNLTLNFKEYLKYGYYPFYFEDPTGYPVKLNQTISTVLEVDIPSIFPIEYHNILNLKKLIGLICQSVPYTPNIKELMQKMDMGENYKGLYRYLYYLKSAKILTIINSKTKGDNIFTKPDKILLNNTNLHYSYCDNSSVGTIREVFVTSMLKDHSVKLAKKGDFLIDDRYLFEVGGKKKSFKQIKDMPNAYVISDDIEIGSNNKIPLWLFGFLY
jgi:predicted AAA+ superfamily ATPase